MRTKLLNAVLIVATIVALSASVYFFPRPQEWHDDSRLTASAPSPKEVETFPRPGRVLISSTEASTATTRKLLPPATKSLLRTPERLKHGDYVWNEEGVSAGRVFIWVDLRRQMISAFRQGHEIGTAVIVYGARDMSSPEGVFQIISKSSNYHSRTYDAPMPHSLFITKDGVALHGSPMSERRASHGCIGLPVEFAQKLFDASRVGDVVSIVRSDETRDI